MHLHPLKLRLQKIFGLFVCFSSYATEESIVCLGSPKNLSESTLLK